MPHSSPNSPADFTEMIETCRKFVKHAEQLKTLAELKYNEILPAYEYGISRMDAMIDTPPCIQDIKPVVLGDHNPGFIALQLDTLQAIIDDADHCAASMKSYINQLQTDMYNLTLLTPRSNN